MKCFLLLRNNKESGPYDLDEIRSLQLRPYDLIWIDGKSAAWQYPTEIPELKGFVTALPADHPENKKHDNIASIAPPKSVFVALPQEKRQEKRSFTPEQDNFNPDAPELETKYSKSLDEIKEIYVHNLQERNRSKKSFIQMQQAAFVVLLIAGLTFGAIIIKDFISSSTKNSSELDKASSIPMVIHPDGSAEDFQNALSTEFVPTDTAQTNAGKKKTKPVNMKKMIGLKSNDFKVGILGGISNLKLTVQNNSPHFVDKVTVEIRYMKPNGTIVNTQRVSASAIKPDDEKIIDVPASKRGVKVDFSILKIQSQEYKASMEEI